MNVGLAVAAVLALGTWAIHTFVGGPQIAAPLLRSELLPVAKYTNYYCWHLVTLVLLAMAGGFAWAAARPDGLDLAVLLTILSASFAAWSGVLVAWSRRSPVELPQWSLFAAITVAGAVGSWTGS